MVDSPLLLSLHARELVRQVDNCEPCSPPSQGMAIRCHRSLPFPRRRRRPHQSLRTSISILLTHSLDRSTPTLDGRDLKFHYARKPITVYSFLRRWPSGLAPGGAEQPVPIRRKVPDACKQEPSVGHGNRQMWAPSFCPQALRARSRWRQTSSATCGAY